MEEEDAMAVHQVACLGKSPGRPEARGEPGSGSGFTRLNFLSALHFKWTSSTTSNSAVNAKAVTLHHDAQSLQCTRL